MRVDIDRQRQRQENREMRTREMRNAGRYEVKKRGGRGNREHTG